MGALEAEDLALRAKTETAQLTRIDINHKFNSAWQIIRSFGGSQAVENGNTEIGDKSSANLSMPN